MAFNPSLPVAGSEIDAAELRAQFNGLNDLLAAQAAQLTTQAAQIAALQGALDTAIAGTARNPSPTVSTFTTTLSDPVSASQAQAVLEALNALISATSR